ncbi:MAG: anti-sigma factor antagonist [Gaiellaceae bacterium]|jgi:anti-anti-sigma factor|nr:anti-sigma factor antagonist [Gaiellaceae bacterium]
MVIPPFRATVAEIAGRVALVSVSGELDLYVENDLREALASAELLATPTVVVDLSGVSFMDSTGCGILVAEMKRRRRHGGELVLVSNGNSVGRVLEVAGIDQIVAVYPTLHAAFQELLLDPVA